MAASETANAEPINPECPDCGEETTIRETIETRVVEHHPDWGPRRGVLIQAAFTVRYARCQLCEREDELEKTRFRH